MLSVSPQFTGIVSTGQCVIPIGTRNFTINVVSGSCNVTTSIGTTLLLAGNVFSMGMPDSKTVLNAPIVLGITGGLASSNKTVVYYNL